jgi:hypothetical protein
LPSCPALYASPRTRSYQHLGQDITVLSHLVHIAAHKVIPAPGTGHRRPVPPCTHHRAQGCPNETGTGHHCPIPPCAHRHTQGCPMKLGQDIAVLSRLVHIAAHKVIPAPGTGHRRPVPPCMHHRAQGCPNETGTGHHRPIPPCAHRHTQGCPMKLGQDIAIPSRLVRIATHKAIPAPGTGHRRPVPPCAHRHTQGCPNETGTGHRRPILPCTPHRAQGHNQHLGQDIAVLSRLVRIAAHKVIPAPGTGHRCPVLPCMHRHTQGCPNETGTGHHRPIPPCTHCRAQGHTSTWDRTLPSCPALCALLHTRLSQQNLDMKS